MREVIHQYGVESDWMESMAVQLDGYVQGSYIKVPEGGSPGTRYVCAISNQITAFLVDVVYHEDVVYRLRNTQHDFISLFFNLTEGNATHILNGVSRSIGRWGYNLSVFDSNLDGDYLVKSGCTTYMIAIFIKKNALKEYISDIPKYNQILESVFEPELNTIVRFDRMSNQAWWLMDELRRFPPGGPLYDVFIQGTVYGLISDYLDQLLVQEIILEKVVQEDVSNIISSQSYLVEHIKDHFPGIPALASKACMSETKYKKIFKKITGDSANSFFLTNKLSFAKELLEKGNHTVAEIADEFNFFDASHLIEQFRNSYGVSPKEYLIKL
ncbi:helix-turn-helix domain-containing protein [Pedobacter hartonius]|uniref:AraC-type DNA-binding protein n=1 Tax=Pedobacter hartonius TaxID=425514 RepID=A0A1H4GM30_9SPHI|nr:AraC family transcriptional regulator [Pedobacter hartonius]SEB10656.1 AraC-type DNA-binding protein [Pedobacter hartonius]